MSSCMNGRRAGTCRVRCKEVEAESVAFVVASVHGMATDDYSFPYVAAWAGEQAARAVSETQARVAGAAKAIIAVSTADARLRRRVPGSDNAARWPMPRAEPGADGGDRRSGRRNSALRRPRSRRRGRRWRDGPNAAALTIWGTDAALVGLAAGVAMVRRAVGRRRGVGPPVRSPGPCWPALGRGGRVRARRRSERRVARPGRTSILVLVGHRVPGPRRRRRWSGAVVAVAAPESVGPTPTRPGSRGSPIDARSRTAAGAKSLCRGRRHCAPRSRRPTPPTWATTSVPAKGVGCWASVEDSIFLLGPPRSGKGLHLVIPSILDAPGRGDHHRHPGRQPGRHPHRPPGFRTGRRCSTRKACAAGVPSALRWSPVRGCERPQTAMIRALALCAGRGAGNRVEQLLEATDRRRGALPAARRRPRRPCPSRSVPVVPGRPDRQRGGRHPGPLARTPRPPGTASWTPSSPPTRANADSVWAMVANAFAALADPHVLDAVSPGPANGSTRPSSCAPAGTLYLLGTASGARGHRHPGRRADRRRRRGGPPSGGRARPAAGSTRRSV